MISARTGVGIVALVLAVAMIGVGVFSPGLLRSTHKVRILAGSELRDVLENPDFVEKLRRATGVELDPDYTGTLQGVQQALDSLQAPTAGDSFDLSWFSTPTYLQLATGQAGSPKLPAQEFQPTMRSPVVLGVRMDVARQLGWTAGARVGWQDIADAAGAGRLTFASADAATSNSGFSALLSVAAAFDRSPATALASEDVDKAALARLFSGRTIKEESSGPLTDTFCRARRAAAIITYESEILAASERSDCGGALQVIYPEGSVYADYPLVHLRDSARTDAENIRGWLRSAEGQNVLVAAAQRRPVRDDISAPAIPKLNPSAVSLPDLETIRQLIADYLDVLQRPSRTIYVLDVSQSMQGERINELRDAMCSLTGTNPSTTSQFIRFRANERVTVVPFAGTPLAPAEFRAESRPPDFSAVCDVVRSLALSPQGGTAVFDAVQTAWDLVAAERSINEGLCTTVVLMTDGESNTGRARDGLGPPQVPTFVIRFGEADPAQLQPVADRSGGRLLDATQRSLRTVFAETRSLGC